MRKIKFLIGVLLTFVVPVLASAQDYTNQEKIPGQPATGNLVEYLNNLYNFGIGIAAILAVFMVAMGAFIYIFTSAGNASKMTDAKDMIKNAMIGLVLTLTAYLLLFIINPDLVGGTLEGPRTVLKNVTGLETTSNSSVDPISD